MANNRQEIIRLVEAQISAGMYEDLGPEEMVDAAFRIVDRIDQKIIESEPIEAPPQIQLR